MDTRELIRRRKDRAIAIVLTYKENNLDASLTKEQSTKLRKIILDQFNDLYQLVLDVLPEDDGVLFNDQVWEERLSKIDQIHSMLFPDIDVTDALADLSIGGKPLTVD